MNTDHLLQMANRIGQFFEAQPDRAQALADTATHIRRFWAPGVRADLARVMHQQGGHGLTPFVHEALCRYPDSLESGAQVSTETTGTA